MKPLKKSNLIAMTRKIVLAGLVLASITTFGQEANKPETDTKGGRRQQKERKSPEERSKMMLERMTKELKLDAKQQEQIKPILDEQFAQFQGMRKQRGENGEKKELSKEERKALMEKRKAEKTATDAKLKAILTPEQYAKMKANEEAMKERMRERMSEHGGFDGGGQE